mgnify:CR=1 FL=1
MGINLRSAKKLMGKNIYAIKKDGTRVTGKLVRISGNRLFVRPTGRNGKPVRTSAIIPLALFDLLAIGTSPYAYGPYGYPYGGLYGSYPYGGYGGYGGFGGFIF